VAIAAVGFVYERVMAAGDARSAPVPGQMVSVDGHLMHLNCSGSGTPTVVLDAGLGGWSLDWSSVQPELAGSTRVCSYDRSGIGWSSPGRGPADAQHAIGELHTLLANAKIDGPLVLVGHSNGGLRMLLYAAAYHGDVAGLVLVDPTPISTSEESFGFLSPNEQAELVSLNSDQQSDGGETEPRLLQLMQTLQPFGVTRLLSDRLLQGSAHGHLSAALQPAYRAGINRASFVPTLLAETGQRQTSIHQVRKMGRLHDTPLVLLGSSTPSAFYSDPASPELAGRLSELALRMLDGSRQDLARLSSTGRVEAVDRSGHYIQFDRPDAVIQAIQAMLATTAG
jgi:pimeloyl-ACP methyl ester carboxylesterase